MKKYIIDFDNTITKGEALDELAKISLATSDKKDVSIEEIEKLTSLAMTGNIGFDEALQQRIQLLQANQYHVELLLEALKKNVSNSFIKNRKFIEENADNIYIVSGGFKEFILPVVLQYGIHEANIYANAFEYDAQKNIVGFDKSNPLSKPQGKVYIVKSLLLKSPVIAIGDGFTDYELKKYNTVDQFYLYTEHITRSNLLPLADKIISSFDQLVSLHYA
jgi:D-3-phosphoglycerate dehydrogenase